MKRFYAVLALGLVLTLNVQAMQRGKTCGKRSFVEIVHGKPSQPPASVAAVAKTSNAAEAKNSGVAHGGVRVAAVQTTPAAKEQ